MLSFFSRTIVARNVFVPFFLFVILVLFSTAFFVVASEESFRGKNIFQDSDQDGLTDEEEKIYETDLNSSDTDGDGYGDGAEVRSGYNPLVPAPGDKIFSTTKAEKELENDVAMDAAKEFTAKQQSTLEDAGGTEDTENLTKQVSEQIANILKSSSEENGTDLTSLNSIQGEVDKFLENSNIDVVELPEVSRDEITIKKQAYKNLSEEDRKEKIKQDALEYVTKIAYVVVSNSPKAIHSPEDLTALSQVLVANVMGSIESGNTQYLDDLTEKGNAAVEELRNIEVPENMVDSHMKAIQFFKYAATIRDEIKPYDDDPMRNIVALSKVQGLISSISNFVLQLDSQMKEIGISDILVDL